MIMFALSKPTILDVGFGKESDLFGFSLNPSKTLFIYKVKMFNYKKKVKNQDCVNRIFYILML